MTEDELARLEALAEKATPNAGQGWAVSEGADDWGVVATEREPYGHVMVAYIAGWSAGDREQDERADAEFIAASRTAVPRLIALVREKDREITSLRAALVDHETR